MKPEQLNEVLDQLRTSLEEDDLSQAMSIIETLRPAAAELVG